MPLSRTAAICAAIAFAGSTYAQTNWPPDHTKANVKGREGMLLYPTDEKHQPIEPRNCFVQLAPMEALHQRHTYRCGEWFLPPKPGAYRCWVELEGRVSTVQTLLRESGNTPFNGSGFIVLHPTVAAGYVAVPQSVPPGHTVRYLHLDQPGYGFSMRMVAATASKPSPMPPGRVFAGIYRDDEDAAVALARPVSVESGRTTEVRIDPPDEGSDLLVMLHKPSGSPTTTHARLRVQSGDGTRDADVVNESRSWLVAVWYGLPAATVTLSVDATGVTLQKTKIQLEPAKVTTIRRDLSK